MCALPQPCNRAGIDTGSAGDLANVRHLSQHGKDEVIPVRPPLVVEAELSQALEEAAIRSPHELNIEVDENLAGDIENASEEGFSDARSRVRSWRKKAELGDQVRLSQELSFSDKIGLIEVMGLAPQLANRCRAPYGASGPDLIQCLKNEVKELRNAVAHDRGELADERLVWRWMLTTFHLATDLGSNRAQ